MVSTTQTLSQNKSQKSIGHKEQHFMTTNPLTHVTNGIQDYVKCCIKRWVHLDLPSVNMLFSRLRPVNTLFVHVKLRLLQ